MKAKIIACLTAFALIFSGGGITVFAEETPQSPAGGTPVPVIEGEQQTNSKWQGEGTQESPYLIQSVADLTTLATSVNVKESTGINHDDGQYENIYFKLTDNLDLSGISNWTPIGVSGDACFSGHFDGAGHTISNLKSSGYETAGLFGYVAYGSVSNLTVEKANISAVNSGAWNFAFAGPVMAVAVESTVTNCEARDSKVTAFREDQTSFAGGFVGDIVYSTFDKCASVNNSIVANSYEGGFAASVYEGEESTFTSCYVANCNITATNNDFTFAGFFIGQSQGGNVNISNSFIYGGQITVADEHNGTVSKGLFINPSQYGSVTLNNDFYSVDENNEDFTDKNSSGMASKTKEELNIDASTISSDFIPGKDHPILKSAPADYTEVDAAIAKANALNKEDYKDFSAVTKAIDAVVRGKTVVDQTDVDAMAKAITDAIGALEKREATPVIVTPPSSTPTIVTPSNGTTPTVSPRHPASYFQKNIQFRDVPNSGDLKTAVDWGVEKGFIKGVDDTHFNPKGQVTRAQFVAFLYRLAGSPSVTAQAKFNDVNGSIGGADFAKAVNWAAANDIVKGFNDGSFRPADPVTREQAVAILHRYVKNLAKTGTSNFTDVKHGAWYENDVNWGVANGIINGYGNGLFGVGDKCTRGQAVQFIYRAVHK